MCLSLAVCSVVIYGVPQNPHARLPRRRPAQGFVEVTIKRLESMILDEIINLRSKGLLHFYSDSKVKFDAVKGTFEKQGAHLKIGDRVFDAGKDSDVMEVKDFVYPERVPVDALVEGTDYDIALPREKRVRNFRLVQMEKNFDWYHFTAHEPGINDVVGSFGVLPPVYMSGHGRVDPAGIIVDVNGSRRELSYDANKRKSFFLDFSRTHVMAAIG